jgi:hypothetical protein
MNVVLDEAREAYAEEIIVALKSEDTTDLESNVSRIVQWIESWLTRQSPSNGVLRRLLYITHFTFLGLYKCLMKLQLGKPISSNECDFETRSTLA